MPPPKLFTSDGCSGFMSFFWEVFLGKDPPWACCCEEHDRAYWQGGPNSLRLDADIKVLQCVRDKGHPHWAVIMFIAVRIGGIWWLPFPSVRKVGGKWRFLLHEGPWGEGGADSPKSVTKERGTKSYFYPN